MLIITFMASANKSRDLFEKNNIHTNFENHLFEDYNSLSKIERNLFKRTPIKTNQNWHYNVDYNHKVNKRNTTRISVLNSNTKNRHTTITLNSTTNITYSKNNTTSQISQSINTAYNVPISNIKMNTKTEPFSETTVVTPSQNNYYEGSGAPSTFAPIGDAVLPLLLLAIAYIAITAKRKH